MEVTETACGGRTNLHDHKNRPQLGSSQKVPARVVNPLKLMALLREEFGLGRYEISVSKDCSIGKLLACDTVLTTRQMVQSVYNIRTPRPLSLDEIAQCRGA